MRNPELKTVRQGELANGTRTPNTTAVQAIAPVIVDDSAFFAEVSSRNQEARERRAGQIRRAALDQLEAEFGDAPITERMARARGCGRPRYRESRRTIARREAVLGAAVEFTRLGREFSFRDLALAIGDQSTAGPQRVRHAVNQLVRARRWPDGLGPVRQIGGRGV
jgi:hypothetical protein